MLKKEGYMESENLNDILDQKYWMIKNSDGHDCVRFYAVGKKNLFDAQPVFCCEFEFDPNTDKVKRFTEVFGFFIKE